jgi:preprotein translocase subunit YajC
VEALLPFVILLLAFWLLIIRPARMRARQASQLQDQLAPGVEVMTSSGLYATVAAVEEDAVILEASPGTRTRWAKAAVARVVPAPAAEGDEPGTSPGSGEQATDPATGRPE